MITLGINAAFHDSAAALVVDGEIIAASEEERFTRIKHGKRPVPFTAWELPYHAIDNCLREAGAQLADVHHVASFAKELKSAQSELARLAMQRIGALPPKRWENVWAPLFVTYIVNAPRQHAGPYRFHFVDHHLAHQASAFLASPFEQCAVITLDGRGENASTSYGLYSNDRYQSLGEVKMPHSLGLLYEQVTAYLGFLRSSDKYKVMALAAMGDRYRDALAQHVRRLDDGRYEVASIDFAALFGAPHSRGAPLEQRHFDVAAALQAVLEETVLDIARWLRSVIGQPRLAMAGGVALNCVMNARLRDRACSNRCGCSRQLATPAPRWVPRCGSTHACVPIRLDRVLRMRAPIPTCPSPWPNPVGRWRTRTSDPATATRRSNICCAGRSMPDMRLHDVAASTARLVERGKVIGWFPGRMEFGPRALGARSILASPLHESMQARINELKDREDFRPVAPAVPEERLADWFTPAEANGGKAPFTLFIYGVPPDRARANSSRLPPRPDGTRADRVGRQPSGLSRLAGKVRRTHRRACPHQHLVQRPWRTGRVHPQGRAGRFLQHPAGRAGHWQHPARETQHPAPTQELP